MRDPGRLLALPAALVWGGLFAGPLAFFLAISFWSVRARVMRPVLTLANYARTFADYGTTLLSTLAIAAAVALMTTALAFAFAFWLRFRAGRLAVPVLFVTLLTLFGGYLVKIYAWKSILGRDGILNLALVGSGILSEPSPAFIYSPAAVVVTLVHFLLPLAILPIWGSLRALPDDLVEAAQDLGAGGGEVLRGVILPLAAGGVTAAFTLTFLIAAGDYVTPRLVGGGAAMIGHFIETQFSIGFNWPLGSAMAFTTMAASLLVVALFRVALLRATRP